MPTNTYSTIYAPINIQLAPDGADTPINVPDSGLATNVLCRIQISAPDEGSGKDPSLLDIILLHPNFTTQVTLQSGTPQDIGDVTFDTGRAPATGSMNDFDGLNIYGDWSLIIKNFSGIATGTINDWSLTLTYPDPASAAGSPLSPTAPAARTIPGNTRYGTGIPLKQNMKLTFNFPKIVSAISFLDKVQLVPYDSTVGEIKVIVKSTGTSNILLSMHKVSSGVDTVMINQNIVVSPGLNYTFMKYANLPSSERDINKDDILYFSIDSAGDGVESLTAQCTLNARS